MKTASNSRVLRTIPLVLIVGLLCSSAYGKIIYVDDDSMGANDGTRWENAYNFLQDALADANSAAEPVEIRVAQGVYTPDSDSAMPDGTGDSEATFRLINGVALQGGYAGIAEPDPDARDVATYETILSGDLNGDDVEEEESTPKDLELIERNREENSYHVVTGSSTDQTAVLDGFTITGGNGRRSEYGPPDDRIQHGGGMYNSEGSPTLTNCTFSGNGALWRGGGMCNEGECSPTLTNCIFSRNSAFEGGGMYNDASSPTLTNCTFSGNSAPYGDGGGGMYNYQSSPTLTNCTFSGNSTTGGLIHAGGGMNNYQSSPTLTNCTFSGNSTNSLGGGMSNNASSPTLTNCTFSGNWARHGGGMHNSSRSLGWGTSRGWGTSSDSGECSPTLVNCTFSGNSAYRNGGGMCNEGESSPTLTNCTFSGNSAEGTPFGGNGGGMYNEGKSSPTLTNCSFSGNSAYRNGGGMSNNASSPTLTNCTFSGNSSKGGDESWRGGGGGMSNHDSSNPTLIRCTFSGNSTQRRGGGMYNNASSPSLTNCTFAQNSVENVRNGYALACESYSRQSPCNVELVNCILWDGGDEIRISDNSTIIITYSNIQYSNLQGGWPGEGNIDTDPLFVDLGYWADINDPNIMVEPDDPNAMWIDGDYHLKSEVGRWDTYSESWVMDDVTSPCIDAGDPLSPVMYEPHPRGCFINMGAYGGTEEASKSLFNSLYELDGE